MRSINSSAYQKARRRKSSLADGLHCLANNRPMTIGHNLKKDLSDMSHSIISANGKLAKQTEMHSPQLQERLERS